jgi:MFS family permease
MAAAWAVFWITVRKYFVDAPPWPTPPAATELQTRVPAESPAADEQGSQGEGNDRSAASEQSVTSASALIHQHARIMTWAQWGVAATMCWFAMTCFFILGAWESNIPVFTASSASENPFHFSPFASGNLIALGGACTIPFLLMNLHYARRVQDRNTLAVGTAIGGAGLLIAISILAAHKVNYGSFFIAWFLVALGFNIASTVTLALLSKQMPGHWNGRISVLIQCSNYTGRVTGAVWGGAGVKVGMLGYIGLQLGYVAIGGIMFSTLWHSLKAKTG